MLISMSSHLAPLPEKRFIAVKLTYRKPITPPDYQPPLFQLSKERGPNFHREDQAVKFALEHVSCGTDR